MAFYNEKGWWKSKTVWTGIIGALFGVLTLFGIPLPVETSETVVGAIMAIIGALTVVFRVNATEKVTVTNPTT